MATSHFSVLFNLWMGSFNLWMGLMQVECLSPSLFVMYFNAIEDYFNKIDYAGINIEGRKICVLQYADDLVLIAKSKDGLQKRLNSLYSYCAQNKMTVNTAQSKAMHFTKKINKINERNTVYYGTSSLEWVAEFKYLGIIIAQNNTFGRALKNLCQQSKRAQAVLDLHIHRHPTLSVDHIMRLFDILIRPILTLDCEIWGVGNYDVIEKVYLNFVKKLLGVKPNTNITMLYAESGSFPFSIYIRKTVINYWLKIMNSGQQSLPGIVLLHYVQQLGTKLDNQNQTDTL